MRLILDMERAARLYKNGAAPWLQALLESSVWCLDQHVGTDSCSWCAAVHTRTRTDVRQLST